MAEIRVPRLSSNDDTVSVKTLCVAELTEVQVGTIIAVVEDSKATYDVEADAPGFLRWRVGPYDTCRVGDVLALVFAGVDEARAASVKAAPAGAGGDVGAPAGTYTVTQVARELAEQHGVTAEQLAALGKPVIRRADVEALIADAERGGPAGAPVATLSKRQLAVLRTVTESSATIPQAFLLVRANCDALLDRLKGRQLGLPEVVVRLCGDLRGKFPELFGSLRLPDRLVLPGAGVNVGVTMDLGQGLFVPVFKDVGAMTLTQVGDAMKSARRKALDGSFDQEELAGAHLSVSLNVAPDVVVCVPLVHPGQAAMLSVNGVIEELALGEDGQVKTRRYTHLGLAYDHRVINGAYALDVLKAMKRAFESPDKLAWLG